MAQASENAPNGGPGVARITMICFRWEFFVNVLLLSHLSVFSFFFVLFRGVCVVVVIIDYWYIFSYMYT